MKVTKLKNKKTGKTIAIKVVKQPKPNYKKPYRIA